MTKQFHALSLCLALALGLGTSAMAQVTQKNGTPQAPNFDFEVWDNDAKLWGWNSSTEAEFGNSPSRENRKQSLWKSNDKRPGSKGNLSAYIKVTQSDWYHYKFPFGTTSREWMGTITTGVPYYYDDKWNEATCMYTNTGADSKRWSFNAHPDSIVFWAKAGLNGGRNSDMTLYLHNNAKLEDRANGNTAVGTVIGKANVKISGNTWKRYSAPIVYDRTENPSYLLLTFTAGNSFREVEANDELWVDDVLLVYNPRLRIDLKDERIAMPIRKNEDYPKLSVPFSLRLGTADIINPSAENMVYAELSDENGSFDNPRVLNSFRATETNGLVQTSGFMEIQIPKDLNIPDRANYKLRLRASNYPILSENVISLDLFYQYQLTVKAEPAWATNLSVDMILRGGDTYTASFDNVITGRHLAAWMGNNQNLGNAPTLTLTMDRDYDVVARFDTNYYPLSAWAERGGRVAINGIEVEKGERFNGELIHNADLTLTATNDFGYHFKEWQRDGETFSTENTLRITFTEAMNLNAVFDLNTYNLAFTAVPDEMGTVSGSGEYEHFASASSTATPAEYAQFKHWRKAGETESLSYEPTLTIESVDGPATYEAVFASQTFNVSTAASPAQHGLTFGDATYEAFPITAQAQVEATPNAGYHFTHWTYAVNGQNQAERISDNPYVFAENTHIAQNYAFTAHFEIDRYDLTAQAEHGMVSGLGTFDYNTEVTLTATPDYGYAFKGWFEGEKLLGSETTLTLNLTGHTHLTALFTPKTYPFTFVVSGGENLGRITQPAEAEGLYEHFSHISLVADAKEGNEFRYWVIDGDTVSSTAAYVLDVDGGHAIEAVFSPLRKQLSLLNPTPNMGSVSGNGLYEHGTAVSLSAEVNTGYTFKGWLLSADNILYAENPLNIEALTEHRTYTAVFEPIQYPLCLSNTTPEKGEVLLNGTAVDADEENCQDFPYLTMIELTAAPAPGHRFVGWINAATQDTLHENPYRFPSREEVRLSAVFDLIIFNIQGAAYPDVAATVEGSGIYFQDSAVTLTATPKFGFAFEGWYDEQGEKLEYGATLNMPATKDVYYVARFSRLNFDLNVATNNADYGTVAGGGQTPYGYTARVEAIPAEGYQFNGWYSSNDELVSEEAVYYPVVMKEETLTAHFGPKVLNLNFACAPEEAGRIEVANHAGDEAFYYGQALQIQAMAHESYAFSHWTDQVGNILSETMVLDLTPTADMNLTAHFTPRVFNALVSVEPAIAGTLAEDLPQTLTYGETYTVSVVPANNEHFNFIGWRNAQGKVLSTETTYTFTFLNEPLVAQFEGVPVEVNLMVEENQGGTIQSNGAFRYYETITLTALPDRGHYFVGWYEPAPAASENPNEENQTNAVMAKPMVTHESPVMTRVLTGNFNIVARFERETYNVSVAALPENGGQIESPTQAKFGERVTLQAIANEGFRFAGYENADKEIISYDPTYSLSVENPLSLNARFEPLSFTLKALSTDKTLGQTKGSGLFTYGQTTTIKAWATAPGYGFSHWSSTPEGNDTLSTDAEWTYTITAENRVVYACFQRQDLMLELSVNLPHAGVVLGGGKKTYGEKVTIHAIPNEGYIWRGFSEHEVLITKDQTYSFVLTENRHIVAEFVPQTWSVKTFDLAEGIKVKGEGDYAHNSEVVLEAILPEGFDFEAWVDEEGQVMGLENPLRTNITGNLSLKPICTLRQLALNVEVVPAAAGKVLTEGFTNNQGTFAYNELVNLQVEENHGYIFMGWEENGVVISRENPYPYQILEESHIKAIFQAEGWNITTGVNITMGGSTLGDGLYLQGDMVEVTATAAKGFEFAYWAENGESVSTEPVYRFEANGNRTLLANFQLRYYQIKAEADPVISAKVTGSGKYSALDTVTLSAILNNNYAFLGWEYEGEILSQNLSYRFVPESDMMIVAKTEKLTAEVSVTVSPVEGGTITGIGEYRIGTMVNLSAKANAGYVFSHWADQDLNVIGIESVYSFVITEDIQIVAVFEEELNDNEDPKIVFYPLPFSDQINLVGDNISDITWFNAFGVQVAHFEVNHITNTTMRTENWPRGIYTYRVRINGRRELKGKVIKF